MGTNWAVRMREKYEVHATFHEKSIKIDGVSAHQISWKQPKNVFNFFGDIRPDIVVNTAGFTDVEGCEKFPEKSFRANVEIARNAASMSKHFNSKFLHISTDHLFDGSKSLCDEKDAPKPLNNYAKHKLDAEIEVAKSCPDAIICRTNFVGWGPSYRRSFSDVIFDKLGLGTTLYMYDDVFFTPVSCSQLIDTAHALIAADSRGVFNICSNERISKYEFSVKLAKAFHLDAEQIQPVQAHRKKIATKRPKDLSLSNRKICKELGIKGFSISDTIKSLQVDTINRKEISKIGKIIPYGKHLVDENDIEAVSDVLRNGQLTQGPEISNFERNIAAFVGAKYAVAVSSATAGLHLAYLALGLKPGYSVVTSPITFVSTSNAAVYCGGHVHFADIDPKNLNIYPKELEHILIKEKDISIVAPVHFAGTADGMREIFNVTRSHNKFIVEDAAHSLGGKYDCGTYIGSCKYSDCTVFSLHPVKSIAAGEGGIITTNDEGLFKQLLRLRSHGINKGADNFVISDEAITEEKINPWYYEMQYLGYNYRITDIQAALANSQLEKLISFQSHRRALAKRYSEYFENYKFASQAQLVDSIALRTIYL